MGKKIRHKCRASDPMILMVGSGRMIGWSRDGGRERAGRTEGRAGEEVSDLRWLVK